MFTQRSYVHTPADASKKWYVVDANEQIVGRLATEVARILKGKNSPKYTSNADAGDFVIVINAEKVRFTGKKWQEKFYFWHTNHIGGIKKRSATEQLEKHPELIVYDAVKGMLPKSPLGRKQLTKLKVYTGAEHPHAAQAPVPYELKK